MFYTLKNLYLFDLLILIIFITAFTVPAFLVRKQPNRLVLLILSYCAFFLTLQFIDVSFLETPKLSQNHQLQFEEQTKRMYALHSSGDTEASLNEAHERLALLEGLVSRLDLRRIEAIHDVGWLNWKLGNFKEARHYLEISLDLYARKELSEWYIPNYLREMPAGVHGTGNEHYILAHISASLGDVSSAHYHFKEALTYFSPISNQKDYYSSIRDSYNSFKVKNPEN